MTPFSVTDSTTTSGRGSAGMPSQQTMADSRMRLARATGTSASSVTGTVARKPALGWLKLTMRLPAATPFGTISVVPSSATSRVARQLISSTRPVMPGGSSIQSPIR